jgi:hypothetical protein
MPARPGLRVARSAWPIGWRTRAGGDRSGWLAPVGLEGPRETLCVVAFVVAARLRVPVAERLRRPAAGHGACLRDVTRMRHGRDDHRSPRCSAACVHDRDGKVRDRGLRTARTASPRAAGHGAALGHGLPLRARHSRWRQGRRAGRIPDRARHDRRLCGLRSCGDSGGLPWWVWLQKHAAVAPARALGLVGDLSRGDPDRARIAAGKPDFVLHLGDIVYPWGFTRTTSAGFFRPFAAVLAERAGLRGPGQPRRDGLRRPAGPGQPAAARRELTGDARCYSFARGAVRIMVLDCEPDHGVRRSEPGHPAFDSCEAELPVCSEPWVIVAIALPDPQRISGGNNADLMKSRYLLPPLARSRPSHAKAPLGARRSLTFWVASKEACELLRMPSRREVESGGHSDPSGGSRRRQGNTSSK